MFNYDVICGVRTYSVISKIDPMSVIHRILRYTCDKYCTFTFIKISLVVIHIKRGVFNNLPHMANRNQWTLDIDLKLFATYMA